MVSSSHMATRPVLVLSRRRTTCRYVPSCARVSFVPGTKVCSECSCAQSEFFTGFGCELRCAGKDTTRAALTRMRQITTDPFAWLLAINGVPTIASAYAGLCTAQRLFQCGIQVVLISGFVIQWYVSLILARLVLSLRGVSFKILCARNKCGCELLISRDSLRLFNTS